MAESLDERLLKFQNDLVKLLDQKPELYPPLHPFFVSVQSEFYSEKPAELEPKSKSIWEIIKLGIFLHGVYNYRIVEMCLPANSELKSNRGDLNGINIFLNPELISDVSDKFTLSFDNPDNNYRERKLNESMDFLKQKGWFYKGAFRGNIILARKLVELTGYYDSFATAHSVSHNEEKKGDRTNRLEANSIYQLFVGENSKIGTFKRMIDSYGLTAAQGEIKNLGLNFFREIIYSIKKMVGIGKRKAHQQDNDSAKELEEYLAALGNEVELQKEEVGFNLDWKPNYITRIPSCIFNRLNHGGKTIKPGKNAHYSLLYSLDPTSSLLFFSSSSPKNPAQAAAILFEVEDSKNRKYLDLEGVVMNKEFMGLVPLPSDYPVFNRKLNRDQRKPYLDQILYHAAKYACSKNLPLFINMTEITSMEECGPHELLYYLRDLFPGVDYQHEIGPQTVNGKEMDLAISVRGGEEIYLRKDNAPLLKILLENQIDPPLEMLSPSGKLKLLNHTWANPRKIGETGINDCEGMARGIVISLDYLKRYLTKK